MNSYVLNFPEIDKTRINDVGGKGANLGELNRIVTIQVPAGFCITTTAYKKSIKDNQQLKELMKLLAKIHHDEKDKISAED